MQSTTRFTVDTDHPSLPGHFPGRPIVPGVLLLERVLEAIEQTHGPIAALRLPQVKFVQSLLPGERAEIALHDSTPNAAGPRRWRFRVHRGETTLASGEVIAVDNGTGA